MKKPKRWLFVLGLYAATWLLGFAGLPPRAEPLQNNRGVTTAAGREPASVQSTARGPARAPRAASAQLHTAASADQRPSSRVVYMGATADPLQANIPELDLALESEGKNENRERELLGDAQRILLHEPTVRAISADCGETFCRLRIDRSAADDWDLIDHALRPIMIGEMIFQTAVNRDGTSLAYAYVSEPDTHLPMSQPEQPRERGGI